MLFVSSGIPSSDSKYRSPYIRRYLEALEDSFNIIQVQPKSSGFLGVFQTNIRIFSLILKGSIDKETILFVHSITHAFTTILLNSEKVFINFHGVEVFHSNRNNVRIPISLYLRIKGGDIKAIFPSRYLLNAVKTTYACSFQRKLVNYSLGVDVSAKYERKRHNEKIKVFYPGNLTYLKGYDTFVECVIMYPDISFYCFPNVYDSLSEYNNVFIQEEYDFNDRYKVLREFDVLLQLSRFESLSLVVLEAYLQNVLCIARRLPVMEEIKPQLPNLQFFNGVNELESLISCHIGVSNDLDSLDFDQSRCINNTLKFIVND
jgi:glycosyltransferase involved in cell wall biosynthesis